MRIACGFELVIDATSDDYTVHLCVFVGKVLPYPPHVSRALPIDLVGAAAFLEFDYHVVAGLLVDREQINGSDGGALLPANEF